MAKGYLASDNATFAEFIQWTRTTDGAVYGTIQIDNLEGTPPSEDISTGTDTVTGKITGSNATLLIDSEQIFGIFSDGVLRVNVPQQDGTLAVRTFSPASPEAFDQSVQDLQTRAYNDNQAAKVKEKITSQESAIDQAASTVKQDLSTLAGDQSDIASSLSPFPNDLNQSKADLATTASDEQKVLSEAPSAAATDNQAGVCSDAVQVNSDAIQVNSDAIQVHSDAIGVESSLQSPRNDVGTTQQDFQALVAAQKAQPNYQDGAPTAADVAQVIAATNAAIGSAVNTANGDIAAANQYTAQAFQDANAALAAGSCGGESTAPTPQQPIQ